MTPSYGALDLIIHGANVVAIGTALWALLKIAVPAGLAIRDSMRDTVKELTALQKIMADHEERLRKLEYEGPERRKPREPRYEDRG